MKKKRIYLNAFDMNCVAHQSPGLWVHPEDQSYRYKDIDYWVELAQTLERGRFDGLFIADVIGIYDVYGGDKTTTVREATQVPVNDPMMLVSAMANATQHLGFGITCSTTFEHPYTFARRMSTLDHLTKGRIAWNIVTSYLESGTRNIDIGDRFIHSERYNVAEEYIEVCYKLWEGSWEDDAVIKDKEKRIFTDPTKVHKFTITVNIFMCLVYIYVNRRRKELLSCIRLEVQLEAANLLLNMQNAPLFLLLERKRSLHMSRI